jgi:cysteine desulfurase
VVFTSSGTESVNHAVKGVAFANAEKGKHIVTSNIEHNATLRTLRALKMMDYRVTSVPVDEYGLINPSDVADAIRDDTILVTIMHSNNEIGTIQPIEEIGQITQEKKVIFHCDAPPRHQNLAAHRWWRPGKQQASRHRESYRYHRYGCGCRVRHTRDGISD